MMRIEQLPIERDKLGESPFWDHRIGALYWLDHLGPTVRRFSPRTGVVREWVLPKKGGCACLTNDQDKLIVALADAFAILDLESGACEEIVKVPQERAAIRLSDGRADRAGGFVVGSAVTDFAGKEGAIYRLNHDLSVEILRTELMLSNAICFQPDGRQMHFTDTRSGVVMVCDYAARAPLSEPKVFADARAHGASPDGATVDAEGGLWVAQIRTGEIVRFNPDGSFDCKLIMPVPHVTSVTFGGPELDILYVTTVRETGMQIKSDHPRAGAIFAVHDLGFAGVAEGLFNLNLSAASASREEQQ
ncbi:SMP-30/gluconolactonase/LRE family protein [Paraburkholderia sediminicola]|nr:SMP-30/gluconolactonase/LRE family protein [Paraburkholderia sediminicola]